MSYELAKAYVQIIPTTSGIQGQLESALSGAGTSAGNKAGSNFTSGFGKALGTVGKITGAALVGAGTALAAFTKSSVSAGMGFDSAMSQVAATMGKTVNEITELRDYAQQMGATTVFSATQSAEALNYMALAGYDAEKSMAMLPNVLNLAAAGNIDLASASDMVTDAESALGLTTEETTEMVDQMAKTASKSNTSVAQLGEAYLKIGATARNLAGGTQELSTMLGLLADNGIKGAEGGTHLRNILLSLQQAAEDGTVDFGDFAVAVYDSDGNMRSMIDIVKDMKAGLGDMSQEAKDAITSGIFNKTDLASINALLGTSEERFDELFDAIGDCTGAAQEMADTQLDNLAGDVTLMKSAFEGLQIAISDGATPSIREAVQGITDIIDGIHDLVSGVNGGSQKVKKGFEKIVKGISDGLPDIMKVFSSIVEAVGDMFPELLSTVSKELPGLFNSVMSMAKSLIPGLMKMLPDLISTFSNMAKSLASNLSGIIMPIFKALPGIISSSIQSMDSVLPSIMKSIGNLAGQIIGKLPQIVLSIVKELPGMLVTAVKSIGSLVSGIFTGLFDSMKVELSPEVQVKVDDAADSIAEARDHIKSLMSGENFKVDLSFDVSPAGKSYSDLETIIANAKENIGRILQELNDDSAEKRREDLEDLAAYKKEMQAAYEEEQGILRAKINAVLGILQSENSLTTEQYAEMIGSISAYAEDYKEVINNKYDAMIAEAYSEAQVNEEKAANLNETITELMNAKQRELDRTLFFNSQAEDAMITHNTNLSGIWDEQINGLTYQYAYLQALDLKYGSDKDASNDALILGEQKTADMLATTMSNMVQNLDDNTKQAVAATWDMAFEMASAGEQIPADMQESMNLTLATLDSMPPGTESAGKAMVQSLISGTEFYKNELASEWENMALEDIIEKIKTTLGISGSSSSVMDQIGKYTVDGFTKGVGDKLDEVAAQAGMTGQEFLDELKSSLQEKSPSKATQLMGENADQGLINGVKKLQGSVRSSGYNVGNMLSSGVAAGINDGASWVTEAASTVVNNAIRRAKAEAEIASPSKKMRKQVGRMMPAGMALGIIDNEDLVLNAVDTINDDMMESWGNVSSYSYGMDLTGTVRANADYWDPGRQQNAGMNKIDRLISLLEYYLPDIADRDMVMDTGEVVGALRRKMDQALGQESVRAARRMA